jgi:hypothetical protein
MGGLKKFLVVIILIVVAFGVGYGLEYMKLRDAEKEWDGVKKELQSKIAALEKNLAVANARVSFWETSLTLLQISTHVAEKNFGLAMQSLAQLKENFSKAQTALEEQWKGKFDFFLPALEEIRNEVQNTSPNAKQKIDELKSRFEQALRSM